MHKKKIAYFTGAAITPDIGCQAVMDTHMRSLLKSGYDIAHIYHPHELGFIKTSAAYDRRQSFLTIAASAIYFAIDACDAVIINGQGAIHHNNGLELLTVAELSLSLNKPTFLLNCTLQNIQGFDDVLRNLSDLTVRESKTSQYLKTHDIEHRLVPDSILEADFSAAATEDFTGKIICTDWHQPNYDTGVTVTKYIERNASAQNIGFYPLTSLSYLENTSWQHAVANFKTAKCIITSRQHGIYLAGLAGVPVITLPSDTYKIEALIEYSQIPIPFCTNFHQIEDNIKSAIANPQTFKDFHNFLQETPASSIFDKLGQLVPGGKSRSEAEIKPLLTDINNKIYRKAKARANEILLAENIKKTVWAKPAYFTGETMSIPNKHVLNNISAHESTGDYKKAAAVIDEHLRFYPADHEVLYHYGQVKLHNEEITAGLKLLHHRTYLKAFYPQNSFAHGTPVWDGAPTPEKVLIWSTAGPGLGSEILLFSFLDEVLKNQPNLIVTCDPRLLKTLSRTFPVCEFYAYDNIPPKQISEIKHQSSIVSLPKFYFGFTGNDNYPAKFPFLALNEKLMAGFQGKYQFGNKLRQIYHKTRGTGLQTIVGISWHTPNPKSTDFRSLPDAAVLKLAGLENTKLISLQHGGDKLALAQNPAIHFDKSFDQLADVERLIHQVAAMDYVITIRNTVAYIAGSLGKKTYLLLPEENNWPWQIRRKYSYFYPTVEIIQKKAGENWLDIVDNLVESLNNQPIKVENEVNAL